MMKFFPKNSVQEQGITLLLAVIMVSGIAIISVTIAFFVMQEVRNARSSTLTEPAIFAAESAGEEALYHVKRNANGFNTTCDAAAYTQVTSVGGPGNNTLIKKCVTSQAATFQITNSEPLELYLYDPTNVQNNTCLEDDIVCPPDGWGLGNQLFTSLEITHVTGSFSVDVDVDTLDGVNYIDAMLSPGATGSYAIDRNILNSSDERLKIVLTPTAGSVTVQVSTTGTYGGLPDYQTLDAVGCRGLINMPIATGCDSAQEIYKRRINITLPR